MVVKTTRTLGFVIVGITTYKDKLIVTKPYFPPSVKMIDRLGTVYWSVSNVFDA